MSLLKLCVGKKAEVPFYMEQLHIRLYSLEELAHYIWENYSLLDEALMDGRLADWIGKECGMKPLADKLREHVQTEGTLHMFAGIILTAVALYDGEEIRYLQKQIQQCEEMDEISRRKTRADRMFQAGGYLPALQEYMALVECFKKQIGKQKSEEREIYGRVLHNMGSCFARMFFYDAAAEFFWQAFEIAGDQKELKYVLLCKKLLLSNSEYELYLQEHMEAVCFEKEVDELVKQAEEHWHKTGNYVEMERARTRKEYAESEEYLKKQKSLIKEWKRKYDTHVLY
ncbi:MAG: hypothetical protein E7294_02285 [Lachnospiraceae bacterium]|jgi:tetratricopeptide (TPR) repeat protein|nr:hypothetical protein [Lachnospiraceae bacterium]